MGCFPLFKDPEVISVRHVGEAGHGNRVTANAFIYVNRSFLEPLIIRWMRLSNANADCEIEVWGRSSFSRCV
jgi:hypothetical protein